MMNHQYSNSKLNFVDDSINFVINNIISVALLALNFWNHLQNCHFPYRAPNESKGSIPSPGIGDVLSHGGMDGQSSTETHGGGSPILSNHDIQICIEYMISCVYVCVCVYTYYIYIYIHTRMYVDIPNSMSHYVTTFLAGNSSNMSRLPQGKPWKICIIASKLLGPGTVAANATWVSRDLSAALEQVGDSRDGRSSNFLEQMEIIWFRMVDGGITKNNKEWSLNK